MDDLDEALQWSRRRIQDALDASDPSGKPWGLQQAKWGADSWKGTGRLELWQAVALSLGFMPFTRVVASALVNKVEDPRWINEPDWFPRLRTLRQLVEFSDRLNIASRFFLSETPRDGALLAVGTIAEERWRTSVVLRDFARWAASQGWTIPHGLKELADTAAPVEGRFQKGDPANDPQAATSCPPSVTVAPCEAIETEEQRVPTSVTRHKIKRRAAPLDPAFEKARAKAGPGAAWSVVWDELVKDAQSESPTPPLADVKDGVVFYGVDPARKLTREAFRKRMGRTAPGP
ncbi:hypothetical protein [Rubrivivax benzoatilyticus]|uniref:Uncharacterized protein n=1 Tax=Rubrivivax benzoatilyticus TaxID=316997 RepID=A0ABX0HS50_9BURK|nr:hypothetical protein [Rubrivivax benzoatilyticus]EGJ11951.1 hypothetical protein RBXJA2T_16552 [Rubrivivax benzoatilyticus JA2 = ATCC BAA-35]NHK97473.1 hypothetical protein [Rubrivivax benzoatilyticus]NHL22832.1 hypothetical protein [Rubrivivax benzoatilyticus]